MPKILISHGFGSNHAIAKNQTPKLREALTNAGFEVEYVKAPIKLELEDFPPKLPPDHDYKTYVLYTWWDMRGKHSITLAEDAIKQYDSDDVVGFIGFSQGGSLSGIVSANFKRLIPSLKFAVNVSGFYYPTPYAEKVESVYDGKIEIPFLSIIGENDKLVLPEHTEKLVNEQVAPGTEAPIWRHDGAHQFSEDDESIEYILNWIQKFS